MAVTHRGAITFGLVYIPVELHTAVQDNDIRFNQLAKESMERVQYKKTCPSCKKELTNADIVKGFQYEKGMYVAVTDEDFEKIKTEKDRSIEILMFTSLFSVSPVYYNKSYQILPEKGGEKAFELLRKAMMERGRVAIGKTVIGNSETMLMLVPEPDGMLMETLYYYDEIKEMPRERLHPELSKAELDMAEQLLDQMEQDFHPEEYKDEYQARLRDMIEKKIQGKEIVEPKGEKQNNIIDLMDALKASVKKSGQPKKAPRKKSAVK